MKKGLLPVVALVLAVAVAMVVAPAVSADPTGNLLVNPGAEAGDFTGWDHSAKAEVLAEIQQSCGWVYPNMGYYFFAMGLDGSVTPAWMEQEIDLTGHGGTPQTFEAGGMVQTEKWWEGWPGAPDPGDYDRGKLFVAFYDASNVELDEFIVDPVENPCCESTGPPHAYAQFYVSGDVPDGAVKALYRLEGHRNQSTYINVFFDDLFFNMEVSPPPTPTPTPTAMPTPPTPMPTPTPTGTPPAVGGTALPTDKLGLLLPVLIGAGALIVVGGVSLAIWNNRRTGGAANR